MRISHSRRSLFAPASRDHNRGHVPRGHGRLRRLIAAGVAVTGLVSVAGCSLAGASSVPESPKKGGTLYINIQGGLDILDPQRTYAASEQNVLRLTTRALTTYVSVPGQTASEVVGDLATDSGRPSEGNRVWDFTLKPNLRWEDGSVVTCTQVKYGIERRFSTLTAVIAGREESMNEGPSYPQDYLQDNATPYKGPWYGDDNHGKGLESVQCLDEKRVRFLLRRPVGDFGYTLAMPTWAPVPPDQDTKLAYRKRPFSNGPYKIDGKLTTDGLVLVRNNFWVEATDQVRKAYPDRIVFNFRPDTGGIVTNEMIEDQGDARNTIMLDFNVAPNFLQQVVNDPDLISRAVTGPTGGVRYMAINTKVVPNIACRQALIYAFNKRKYRAVNGGSVTGDYATTMIPPNVKANKPFDLFDTIANPEGNPDKARDIMDAQAKAKKPCDSTIKVAFPNTPLRRRLINTVVEAYQRAGIEVRPVPLDPATYYSSGIGDPANGYHMMLAGWIPDWANGSAIIPPLFSGSVIPKLNPVTGHASGNVNFSLLDDPRINQQMDTALAETEAERQWALWGDLDEQIQQLAVTIPILYEKGLRMAGSNVRGGFIHPAFGMPDVVTLGLADPTG
jgi:peptide/nickel transport system substrate-binding protein